MKNIAAIAFLLISFNISAQEYSSYNIDLLGTWAVPPDKEPVYGDRYSSCWGYAADGREYAIVGCGNGTAYVDVTDPANPVLVDFVASNIRNAIWREYKTYSHYAYQVSDDGGPNHFDIVDLSYLPDSVHVAYSGDDIFRRAHTIWIDGTRLYRGGNMKIYDISKDPVKPELLVDNTVGYVHDMFVRNDTIYASQGDNGLFIYELKDNKLNQIGSYTNYPFVGYNHSSILTPDGKTLIFTDEVPGNLPAKSLDVSDPANPVLLDTFYSQSGKATLHNPFLAPNNTFVMASYLDGVQVYDYADPKNIRLRGFFDTHWQSGPSNTNGGYDGAWSAYTQLPSGNLITVDISNGLYVLDAKKAYYEETNTSGKVTADLKLRSYPNPASGAFRIQPPEHISGKVEVAIYDMSAKLIFKESMDAGALNGKLFSMSDRGKGTYIVQLKTSTGIYSAEQVIR